MIQPQAWDANGGPGPRRTSKTRVDLGGIVGGAPALPYAIDGGHCRVRAPIVIMTEMPSTPAACGVKAQVLAKM